MTTTFTYRGYEIEELPDGGYVVKIDGEVVNSYEETVDSAERWIDGALGVRAVE